MLRSIRRIANVLLMSGILSLSLTMLSSVSMSCSNAGEGCLATVLSAPSFNSDFATYRQDFTATEATPMMRTESIVDLPDFTVFIQLVSMYTLVTAVLILILLEMLELHYLRRLFHYRKAFRLR